MSAPSLTPAHTPVTYPESDGQPMAENTRQFEYIVTIKCGLEALFRDRTDVFVAGNLFWYPVEGNSAIRQAPDVLVAFGPPPGHRGSYRQWEEGGVAPQVVFEILSPSNRGGEMARKTLFYERYGVEEYYVYDPDEDDLVGWQRQGNELVEILFMDGWVSPRLGVRFQRVSGGLELYGPDQQKFATYLELVEQRENARREAEERAAKLERLRAQLKALGAEPEA